ncbi:MAG: YihY/virulence factor BrkB family protein [Terracidiphilus sp.]
MQQREAYVYASGSPWKLGGLKKKQLAARAWHELMADDVLGHAAQLAYFFLFALFPLGIFLSALIAAFAGTHTQLALRLTREIMHVVPAAAGELVRETIHESLTRSGNGKLVFGIVVALFSASSGMDAMMDTLNTVFDVRESRSFVKQKGVSLLLTIALGILICAAMSLITLGTKVAETFASGTLEPVWNVLQYPVAILFLLLSFSMVYRYAPDMKGGHWRVFTPGAITGLCLWFVASFGLRVYLQHFKGYSDYGTIGAVMVLMLWFYVAGLAFLIGGEVDAIIDRAGTGRKKHERGEPASHVKRERAA